ncbi:MAG: glycoside hydrolase family 3 protein [Butyricicoccus sp.]|nr:glycoside hydrolase family 3 protein [Butyricicoccus sp.]MDY4087181.1 glycoside hydrolase family 3 protein [Butyricicoccus intestinisimiae]
MKKRIRFLSVLLGATLALSCIGCGTTHNTDSTSQNIPDKTDKVQQIVDSMSLEEKVAQLFLVQPEAIVDIGTATAAGDATKQAINKTPVGGFVYFSDNLQSEQQVQDMLRNVQKYSEDRIGLPAFLSVDEEGGTVARVASTGRFDVTDVGDMAKIGASGDVQQARQAGETIGSYLSELGFNLDFAPDADVLTNPDNTVVKKRSFGSDPRVVSDMSLAVAQGLAQHQVYSVYKHFPGHGATAGDTHQGYAYTDKTLDELKQSELIPFENAIQNNAAFIMAAHISAPRVTGDDTPASLSKTMITDILRGQMGYDGIVVTDAMNMGAVTEQYTSAQAAVKALQAGADLVLMPEDFQEAYQGVLDAVKDGTLTEQRINESVTRIVKVKVHM